MPHRRILHLVVDDKFIDSAVREFELAAPGRNEYALVGFTPPWQYVRSDRIVPMSAAQWSQRVRQTDVAAVVVHSMSPHHSALLGAIPPGPTVVWLGWGYDYYGLMADAFPEGLLQPQTTALMARLEPREHRPVPGDMRASDLSVARPCPKPTQTQRQALQRVDVFSPVLDSEAALVRRHAPWFRARHMPWNYMTLEDDLTLAPVTAQPPGPNLLLGNSATPTNNHLEAFDVIRRRVDLTGRQLVVPLSYGNANYARKIIAAGRRLFGDAFRPLVDFMPAAEYQALLDSCGTIVMNHVRQQALGNVVIGGLRGARIFLNPLNPMTRWLHRRGVVVDDLDDLNTGILTAEERERNRQAIVGFTCRAHRRGQTANLVAHLLGGTPS